MNAKIAAALAVLALSSALVAAVSVQSITDDGDDGWDRTSVAEGPMNVNGSNDYVMGKKTSSDQDYWSSKQKSLNGDHIFGKEGNDLADSIVHSRFEQLRSDSGFTFSGSTYGHSGSAFYNGNHYFVDNADDGTFTYLRKWNEDGTSTLVTDMGQKIVAGAADISGSGITDGNGDAVQVAVTTRSDDTATEDDIVAVDVSDGGTNIITDTGLDFVSRGAAFSDTGDSNIWVIDAQRNKLLLLDIKSDSDVDILLDNPLPSFSGKPRGLAVNAESDRYYTYDEGSGKIVIWEYTNDGVNVIERNAIASGGDRYHVGSIERDNSEDFNNGQVSFWEPENNKVELRATDDLVGVGKNSWVSETFDPAGDQKVDVTIDWKLDAPQLWGNYKARAYYSTDGGSTWTQVGSATTDSGNPTDSVTSTFSADSFQLKFEMDPGIHHGVPDGDYPVVSGEGTYIKNEYSYLPAETKLRTHDADDTDLGIDMGQVKSAENLTINGSAPGSSQINLSIRNSAGTQLCTVSGVAGSTVNLSSQTCNWDEDKSQNQRITFKYTYTSDGQESASIDSWRFRYTKRQNPPVIEAAEAELSGRTTTATTVETAKDAPNTFRIDEVDKSVDQVTWYVDGEQVRQEDVSSTGPFTYDKSWQSLEDHNVTVSLFDQGNGSTSQTWDVTLYEIAVQGRDSFALDRGETLAITQRFTTFTNGADISVTLQYNESVVRLISGPEQDTVTAGNSRTWEFQVRKSNYTGQPITFVASYDGRTSTKNVSLSTGASSGSLVIGDQFELFSFTWIPFDDTTAIGVQSILGFTLALIIGLDHLSILTIPFGFSERLRGWSLIDKSVGVVALGGFIVGVNLLVWTPVSTIGVGAYWALRKNRDLSIDAVVSRI